MAGPNPFKGNTPRTPLGLSGLGAVGGAKGTAAGAFRVLVEFVTQYDGERAKQLEDELARIEGIQKRQSTANSKRVVQAIALERKVNKAHEDRLNFTKAQLKDLDLLAARTKKIAEIQSRQTASQAKYFTYRRQIADIDQKIKDFAASNVGLSERMVRNYVNGTANARELALINRQIAVSMRNQNQLLDIQAAKSEELAGIQGLKQQLVPKLGALALGAVGNIFGGAVFALGFQAGQALIDRFTEGLQDMLDPARKAREALKEIAEAISTIADNQKISRLEAATQYLDSLGANARAGFIGDTLDQALASTVQTQLLTEALVKLKAAQLEGRDAAELHKKALDDLTRQSLMFTPEALALATQLYTGNLGGLDSVDPANANLLFDIPDDTLQKMVEAGQVTQQAKDDYVLAKQAAYELNSQLGKTPGLLDDSARAAEAFAEAMQNAAENALDVKFDAQLQTIEDSFSATADSITANAQRALDAIDAQTERIHAGIEAASNARINQLQTRLSNLNSGPSTRTKNIQKKIDGLSGGGDSARTRALQQQIDKLNASEERRQYLSSLAEIAEDRYLLKLQHRLSLTNKEIRLSQYHGKARVAAIEAITIRLQREQREQDRLNKLLDLQYEASKRINRDEGESIQDFITRRAQEYRHQIAERQTLDRQGKEDRLNDLKAEADYRVSLAENTKKRLDVIHARERKLFMDNLQERLNASREADRAAAEAQRRALQAQLHRSQEADRKALASKQKAIRDEIAREQEKKKALIKAIDDVQDARKKAVEIQRARDLANNTKLLGEALKTAKAQQDIIKGFASNTETAKFLIAIKGAKTQAQLGLLAGKAIGSNQGYGVLLGAIGALHLDTEFTNMLRDNAAKQRQGYLTQLSSLPVPKYAKGGIFPVGNSMNFGNNMRAGEGGTEIGVILSNRVTQALRDSGNSGPLVGHLTIESHEDPQRTVYRFKRAIRELQEQSL